MRGDIADNQPLLIEELEGQKRTVTLEGSDLPDQGVTAAVNLREVTTRYPTGEASVQILGVEEEAIELKCTFNDLLTGIDEGAISQVETLRSILLSQGPVQLQWGSALVRRGYLKRVAPEYKLESLIGCTIQFLPVEADEIFYCATPFPQASASDVLTWMDALTNALSALNSAMSYSNAIQGLF